MCFKPTLLRCTVIVATISILAFVYWQSNRVQAQTAGQIQCLELIEKLKVAIADCDDMNSNHACYGSIEADVLPIEYRFQGLRDRRPLSQLDRIDTDENGAVFMNLHLEGQTNSIKTMMFGNGNLDPEEPGQHSYLMTIDNPTELCALTPPGIVLHTEEGESGQVELNGVLVEMRSTAFVTILEDGLMTVVNLEGQVTVTINGVTQSLPIGFHTQISFANGFPQFAIPAPVQSPYANSAFLRWVTDNEDEGIKRIRNTNTTSQACVREIDFGVPLQNQLITNPGHECLYRFCTQTGESFSIEMETVSGDLDSWIDLRGEDGQLLAFNNDIDETDSDSSICNVGLTEPACYTIVARANHNETNGQFNLTLSRGELCAETLPRCSVTTHRGLNLREGPGLQYPRLQAMPQNTQLQPVAFSQDSQWVRVEIQGQSASNTENNEGWVRSLPGLVQCEIQTIVQVEPTVLPPPTSTPQIEPTPTPTRRICPERGLVLPEGCGTPLPPGDKKTPTPTSKPEGCRKCSPFGTP
ncbi:SH3 domain-containing protein [Chloroflexi bacterium TSY]|nr:SH3 domain-containing protein [Chloroflexi bacterium TSY]